MTISQAAYKIEEKLLAGLISKKEADQLNKRIRRSGGYGNQWSRNHQEEIRAIVMMDFE